MELRELATQILFGPSLEDKLLRPQRLRDERPGPALERAPHLPARERALGLAGEGEGCGEGEPAGAGERISWRGDLSDDRRAGRILLAFANHELQAMELFALALLRFPTAPAAWRLELAHVLVEEQEHLRLYLQRARAKGLDLSEAPRSSFFWGALKDMRTPLDVVTGLALTFEQANLDYAAHYAQRFREAGDTDTAQVLDRVLAEEQQHVAHGVRWLREPGFADDAESDWEAYRAHLPAPLTPRRARGLGELQRQARRAAGLSERFVQEVAVYGASKGRPPHVWWFVPSVEEEAGDGRPGYVPSAAARRVQRAFAPWLALLASEDDVVLVPERPSPEWLAERRAEGLALPEFVATGESEGELKAALAELAERPLGQLRPWGWSPRLLKLLEPLRAVASEPAWVEELADPRETLRRIHSKAWAAALLDELLDEWATAGQHEWLALAGPRATERGATCEGADEVEAALASLGESRWRVLKAAYAASGRGLRLLAPGEALDDNARGWLRRQLVRGPLRVEPWWDRRADLSLVFHVNERGLAGGKSKLTWPEVDARGQYRRHRQRGEPEHLRFLHGERAIEPLNAVAERVAQRLAQQGFRGPAGVDALIATDRRDQLWLHPLVEINARATFGHLALAAGGRQLNPCPPDPVLNVGEGFTRVYPLPPGGGSTPAVGEGFTPSRREGGQHQP